MANYRVPVIEKFSWQPPVLGKAADSAAAPAGANSKGDRWIIGATPGAWTAFAGQPAVSDGCIATCAIAGVGENAQWLFDTPVAGWQVWRIDLEEFWYFNGTVWDVFQVTGTGNSGYSGYSGYSGVDGVSGYSGYSGADGTSGYSGSGISGYSGYSGGTGTGFKISKTYASVALLEADTSPIGILTGEFALIITADPAAAENGRLYLWNGSAYEYTVDMSVQGIQGPAGSTGAEGTSGYSGYSGDSGISGYSGDSGISGYSGYSGSGVSGYSGFSGYSGPGAVYDASYKTLIIGS